MKLFKNKKTNQSFGVFHEGELTKIAHLELTESGFVINKLFSTKLKLNLDDNTMVGNQDENQTSDTIDQDFDYTSDDFELPDLSEESENMGFSDSDVFNTDNEKGSSNEPRGDLLDTLRELPLDNGTVAINANDENLSFHEYNASTSRKNYKKEIEETLLSLEERKEKKHIVDYIENPDDSILAFLYKGEFELLDYFEEINPLICEEKLIYNHIAINELSLINFVVAHHTLPEDANVLILYLDTEYKIGVVINNESHVKHFSIDVPEAPVHEMRQTVYSKIMLEKDTSNIDITKHIIFAGEMSTENDLEFFKEKLGDKSIVERVRFQDLVQSDETSPEQISQYVLPLSLAWRALIDEDELVYANNLLPRKIIEGQKHFKLAWHGYTILVLLFIMTFFGTLFNLSLKNNIINTKREISNLQQTILIKENILKRIEAINQQISIIDKDYSKITNVIGKKNQMYSLLEKFSASLEKNKISWINELICDNNGINIKGSTTQRKHVITFSQIFPNCVIQSVTETKKVGHPAWDFEIKFDYPNPMNNIKE